MFVLVFDVFVLQNIFVRLCFCMCLMCLCYGLLWWAKARQGHGASTEVVEHPVQRCCKDGLRRVLYKVLSAPPRRSPLQGSAFPLLVPPRLTALPECQPPLHPHLSSFEILYFVFVSKAHCPGSLLCTLSSFEILYFVFVGSYSQIIVKS